MKWRVWDVQFWFHRGGHSYSSGVNTSWPAEVGAGRVLREAAEMRNVDIDECHDVSARAGEEYDEPD